MRRPDGLAHKNMTPLSVQINLVAPNINSTTILIDYGSAISLISKDCFKKLKNPPKIRKGRKITCSTVSGTITFQDLVTLPVYFTSNSGGHKNAIYQLDVEFYINPSATIDLILGIDWIYQYQISTMIQGHEANIILGPDGPRIECTITTYPSSYAAIITAATEEEPWTDNLCRVAQDTIIAPGIVKLVKVHAYLPDRTTIRFMEAYEQLEEQGEPLHIRAFDTLMSKFTSHVLVINEEAQEICLKRGDALGVLLDPDKSLSPLTNQDRQNIIAATKIIPALITKPPPKAQDNGPPVEEPNYMKEMDEPTDSNNLLHEVHFGDSLSIEEVAQIKKIVLKHAKAFSLDGRLGRPNIKVHINVKDRVEPVGQRMYHATERTRKAIDKIMDDWISQEIISPADSPWRSPIVVVFRTVNGIEKVKIAIDF